MSTRLRTLAPRNRAAIFSSVAVPCPKVSSTVIQPSCPVLAGTDSSCHDCAGWSPRRLKLARVDHFAARDCASSTRAGRWRGSPPRSAPVDRNRRQLIRTDMTAGLATSGSTFSDRPALASADEPISERRLRYESSWFPSSFARRPEASQFVIRMRRADTMPMAGIRHPVTLSGRRGSQPSRPDTRLA